MGDYLGLPNLLSLILLIFPFTAWLFGVLQRCKDGHIIAAIIRLFGGFTIIWVLDIVMTLLNGCTVSILRLLKF